MQRLTRNTLSMINCFNRDSKLIAKNPRCNLFYLVMSRTAVTQQHTHNSDVTACCVLVFVKREVHRCDCLQILVHFYSQVLFYWKF